jgi:hypothetical protein
VTKVWRIKGPTKETESPYFHRQSLTGLPSRLLSPYAC